MIPLAFIKPAVIGLVALSLAYGGYRVGAGLTEAKYLKAAEARQRDAQTRRIARAERVATIIQEGAHTREVIVREIEKPVYRDPACRLTPDGLRILNESLTGQRSAFDSELPGADAARP